jgi:hypothetical protein
LSGCSSIRLYENQLVRQTEAELIAQGAVVAAIYAREVREAAVSPNDLGATVAKVANDASGRYRPIEPRLDLAMDTILPRRPDSVPAIANAVFAEIGARFSGILAEAQDTTLAGFRLLDPSGTVIAGGGDIVRSFAGVEEVRAALAGKYSSVLRTRVLDEPAPPLYSISRGTRVASSWRCQSSSLIRSPAWSIWHGHRTTSSSTSKASAARLRWQSLAFWARPF